MNDISQNEVLSEVCEGLKKVCLSLADETPNKDKITKKRVKSKKTRRYYDKKVRTNAHKAFLDYAGKFDQLSGVFKKLGEAEKDGES